jgi:hypothetical protein
MNGVNKPLTSFANSQEELSEAKKTLDEHKSLLATMVSRSEFADVTARCGDLQTQLADLKIESRRTIDEQHTLLSSLETEKTQLLTTMQVHASGNMNAFFRPT